MRVTEQIKYRSITSTITKNAERLHESFDEVSTGKRVEVSSDDPIAYAAAQRLRAEAERQRGYMDSGTTMRSQFEVAEDSLISATDVLSRMRELTVNYGSDIYTPEQQASAAEEFLSLRDSLIDLANTQVGDSFIFGGVKDGSAPYDVEGAFAGTDQVRSVRVGRNSSVTQLSAGEYFSGTNGGVDTIGLAQELSEAMERGDTQALRDKLDTLDQASTQIIRGRQRIGYELNTIEHSRSFAQNMIFRAQVEEGQLTDVNLPEAISTMQAAKTAYEASAQVSQYLQEMASTALRL